MKKNMLWLMKVTFRNISRGAVDAIMIYVILTTCKKQCARPGINVPLRICVEKPASMRASMRDEKKSSSKSKKEKKALIYEVTRQMNVIVD
jgi:hypothetical protein